MLHVSARVRNLIHKTRGRNFVKLNRREFSCCNESRRLMNGEVPDSGKKRDTEMKTKFKRKKGWESKVTDKW
jgi:hypothetical protein